MFEQVPPKVLEAEGRPPEDETPLTEPAKAEVSWEERFNGMKGTAVKHQKRADKLAAELADLRQQYEEQTLTLGSERDQLKSELEKTVTQSVQAQTELALLKKQSEIGRLIRRDYPALTDLYDEGLLIGLEALEGVALTDYVTRYAQKLGQVRQAGVEEAVSGAKPPPPSQQQGQAGLTLGAAQADLQRALAQHGSRSPEYSRAMENYLLVIQKGGA